jgi:hypothetical protein
VLYKTCTSNGLLTLKPVQMFTAFGELEHFRRQQQQRHSLVQEAAVEDVGKVAAALEQGQAAQLIVPANRVHHQVVRLRGGLLKPVSAGNCLNLNTFVSKSRCAAHCSIVNLD